LFAANLMKQDGVYGTQMQREEFQMASEDFPALGGGAPGSGTFRRGGRVVYVFHSF